MQNLANSLFLEDLKGLDKIVTMPFKQNNNYQIWSYNSDKRLVNNATGSNLVDNDGDTWLMDVRFNQRFIKNW